MLDIKPDDRVSIRAVDMDSIPMGSNPFHHDYFSMGTQLVRGWWAMHDGYDSQDNQFALRHLYLVNTRSGQRVRLEVHPEQPRTMQEILLRVQHLQAETATLLEELQKLVDLEQVS